ALLAGEETGVGRERVAREGERETELDGAAVGRAAFALEVERCEVTDAGATEGLRVGCGVLSFQHQHREALPAGEEVVGEGERGGPRRGDARGFADREQLDEESWELDDAIVRTPRMAVARPDDEAEALVKHAGGVEIAHHVDEVIEPARHRRNASI